MDKDKLLAHFQSHYLSRQEVLYKLPLNYSIDAFWPELLNRRKASAVILPLYNGTGMPYWYVLTDKMISASERLCEEALDREGDFDPYRAQMTGAMTEEMFFTSFVEGAQIPLREAMDFLQRGTEPENIMEQMIWNNRRAWAELTATLYRPMGEEAIRNLAYLLTEGMDGCAEDYRQTDSHPIAAMSSEPYEVPPSYALPDMMRQYTEFLGNPEVHPLIKAAVAQAYLLVTRPFPEGNERLSRMISSAVLLRCGYDFFRDISISSVIAKESYRYYKAMREIIRTENGGDLTYFIEYYLELLVRAVDARKERLLRREAEALEREREMAGTPLSKEREREQENQITIASCLDDGEISTEDIATETRVQEINADESPPDENQFWNWIYGYEQNCEYYWRQAVRFLRELVGNGERAFTKAYLKTQAGLTEYQAKKVCESLLRNKLVTNCEGPGKNAVYQISPNVERRNNPLVNEEKHSKELILKLKQMRDSNSVVDKRIGKFILGSIESDKDVFTSLEWEKAFNLPKSTCRNDIQRACKMGLIKRKTRLPGGSFVLFKINMKFYASEKEDTYAPRKQITEYQKTILDKVYRRFGSKAFTKNECSDMINRTKTTVSYHLNLFLEWGLIKRLETDKYVLQVTPQTYPMCFPEKTENVGFCSYPAVSVPMAAMAG